MFAWRVPAVVLVLLAAVSAGNAQTYFLHEEIKAGDCFRYLIDLQLAGDMRVNRKGKVTPLKLEATAAHAFPERVLSVGISGLPEKVARVYQTAKATITVGKDVSERTLRPGRRLIVAQRHKDEPLVYAPTGALYRPELELTSEHFDTLCVAGLLPGKAVKVGEEWKLPNPVVQALCNFEGMTEQKLTAKLKEVTGDMATFSVRGTAGGVEAGALVKQKIEAVGTFDLKAKRLVKLTWTQKDERDQGPVSPASATEVTVTLTRKAIEHPKELSDVALITVPPDWTPPTSLTQLEYRDAKGRYALLHTREWVLVGDTGEHVVLRLMDKGDFVGQVTVTPWTKAKKGEHISPDDFKAAMNSTSGWRPERELQAGVVPSDDKRWIYRLSEQGQLDGVEVMQNFYLVAAPDGEQVVLSFTLSPKLADKLGARDLALAGSMELPAGK
jgi:hypothetical protein